MPRLHLFEIDDQAWFPSALRRRVQSVLALAWNVQVPVLQSASAATLAANVLLRELKRPSENAMIDCCSGAGGPIATIEHNVNKALALRGEKAMRFCLTDLYPHVSEWTRLKQRSSNIDFIETPVDAAAARDLTRPGEKECRMFNLAFHHLDDPVARGVMADTIKSADAIVIFELQDRSVGSFITITMGSIMSLVLTPIYFWNDPLHLLFTFVIPIIPFVFLFDGYISSLRTRTPEEVSSLLPASPATKQWTFKAGKAVVLPPFGYLHWIIGVKGQDKTT